jgi:NAD(P)-dependent dehydrogenase (short-subunit alcohol dehydrogenase family)
MLFQKKEFFMSESLKGKVALLTGAASGFSKATAELFAKDGCNLILIDIDEAGLGKTAKNCQDSGSKVIFFKGDVTKNETWQKALKECIDNFGKIDFLINYAGGAVKVAPIEELTEDDYTTIMNLNLLSVFKSCKTFTPQLKKQGYGKIINVSSACEKRSWPGWSVYSAAKSGVNSFSRCLYTELRPFGICVTTLVPGGSNTGFQSAAQNVAKFEWDESLAVRPEHFADMVYQICALAKGGCVPELCIYGLAQDVSGY